MEDFEQLEIRAKGEFIIFIDGDDFKPSPLGLTIGSRRFRPS